MHLLKLKPELITLGHNNRLYNVNIPIVAVTGGIATGKSTVTEKLQNLGAPIICADALVKNIYKTPKAHNFLRTHFPDCIQSKEVNFKLLRQTVFNDTKAKLKIEEFIHPKLKELFLAAIPPSASFIVYDVPLLFEKSMEQLVDVNLLVYAPKLVQTQRLIVRDGISEELANSIIDQQMDIEVKKQKAQFILDNSSSPEQLELNFQRLISKIWVTI